MFLTAKKVSIPYLLAQVQPSATGTPGNIQKPPALGSLLTFSATRWAELAHTCPGAWKLGFPCEQTQPLRLVSPPARPPTPSLHPGKTRSLQAPGSSC